MKFVRSRRSRSIIESRSISGSVSREILCWQVEHSRVVCALVGSAREGTLASCLRGKCVIAAMVRWMIALGLDFLIGEVDPHEEFVAPWFEAVCGSGRRCLGKSDRCSRRDCRLLVSCCSLEMFEKV